MGEARRRPLARRIEGVAARVPPSVSRKPLKICNCAAVPL